MRSLGIVSLSGRSSNTDDRRSVASGGSSTASTLLGGDSLTSSAQRSANGQSNLRKFTAGIGRPGLAREAREVARNVISTHNPTRKAPLARPHDYERFFTKHTRFVQNDPHRNLLIFPRDDIKETSTPFEPVTAVPDVLPSDHREANWQLTRDALRLYTSPQRCISFSYHEYAGDYNTLHGSSSIDQDVALPSLVFESDVALEEEKAAEEGFFLSDDVIKEGFLHIVKSDPSLLDNLKSEKKRRWCVLRRLEDGCIAFEMHKTQPTAGEKAVGVARATLIRINSAQVRATKKGRTVLEIEPCPEGEEKGKPLTFCADTQQYELADWLQTIHRALALADKAADCVSVSSAGGGDSSSICGCPERSFARSDLSTADADSIHSEDSYAAHDMASWRGKTSVAKALKPPIVDRRNIFSLYHRLAPVSEPRGHRSSLLPSSRFSPPSLSSSSTPVTLSPVYQPSSPLERKRNGSGQIPVSRFSIEFGKLDMKLPVSNTFVQQIEPLFVRMFLFDSSTGRRLSEEFHVDVNDDELNGLLVMGRTAWQEQLQQQHEQGRTDGLPKEAIANTLMRKMICSVAVPSPSTWLVCRVDRVLSADLNGDLYMRTTGDVKATLKLQKQLQSACGRLGGYRTRFAFAARSLYHDLVPPSFRVPSADAVSLSSSTRSTNANADPDCLQLFRCEGNRLTDSDLQKCLADYSKFEKTSKLLIPGATITVHVDASTRIFDAPLRLSSSYLPLQPWRREGNESAVMEVQPFGDVVAEPHSSIVNLLYVYPQSLKYDSQKVFSKARNICCTVRFMRGGEDVSKEAWLDRLSPFGPFAPQVSCAVQHHQQNPSFGDEMKLRLPLSLGQYDHLLFIFSHVSVVGQLSAKSPNESVETNVGYAWLPLATRRERLLLEADEQEFILCVAAELPKGYYRNRPLGVARGDEAPPDVRWVDQKPLFRVRLRLVSSVYTTQPKLQAFFQACSKFERKGIQTADGSGDAGALPSTPTREEPAARSCSPLCRGGTPLDDDNTFVRDLLSKTRALSEIEIGQIIPFLPLLLNRLLANLVMEGTETLASATLRALVNVVDCVYRAGRGRLLRTFLRSQLIPRQFQKEMEGSITGRIDDDPDKFLHCAIAKHLKEYLKEVVEDSDALSSTCRQMWFLLDVAAKSMAHTIVRRGLLMSSQGERFPKDLLDQIRELVSTLTPILINRHRDMTSETRHANTALAYFLRFCLSFMDRGAVFNWIFDVVDLLDQNESRKMLCEYKADMLTVLSQHEHWLPLCLPALIDATGSPQRLPVETSTGLHEPVQESSSGNNASIFQRCFNMLWSSSSTLYENSDVDRLAKCSEEWHLSESFFSRHFPVGILLQELSMCLRDGREYRKRPIALLRNLLAKHGYDKRYSDMNYQRRIASLYAPLVRFAIDTLGELEMSWGPAQEAGNATDSAIGGVTRGMLKTRSLERPPLTTPTSSRLSASVFRPSAAPPPSPLVNGEEPLPQPQSLLVPLAEKLDSEEVQDILLSVVSVLQRLPKKVASALWMEGEGERALQLLRLLELILDVFRYRGKAHALTATDSNCGRMAQRSNHLSSRSSQANAGAFLRGEDNDWLLVGGGSSSSGSSGAAPPFAVLQMVNLCQEVALISLHTLQTFSQQLASSSCSAWRPSCLSTLFSRLLSLHISLLADHWPEAVRLHSIAALAVLVNLFHTRLLESSSLEELSLLLGRLLLLLASRLASVQLAAAALMQVLLRKGYENAAGIAASAAMQAAVSPSSSGHAARRLLSATERLGKPGAQTGVALARLLGKTPSLAGSGRLEKGLAALDSLVAASDPRRQTPFDKAVLELTHQLRGVMSATGALNQAKNDPIRLADLHIQLADSYRGSAALRSTWLETLASAHANSRWFAEAAVCQAHAVAICARELAERGELKAVDWSALEWISKSIMQEEKGVTRSATRDNAATRVASSVQPAGFTLENLATKIEKTANYLTQAERYEAIGPLYRLIIPAFERNDNFTALVNVYAELNQSYSRALEVKASAKRHLGAYFRVRFFGKAHFDADHDSDWIYREHGLTTLAEVSQRLGDYCRQVVGHDRVKVEPENDQLDLSTLDESIAYVQVTHVEPVATHQAEKASLAFSTHTNVSDFTYEKVQMEGDGCEGEPPVTQRALCKTLLTVSGSFPSTRRRLRIVKRQETLFTPLECACQKLRIMTSQIRSILMSGKDGGPVDVKGLQLRLQGTVLPTVNAGPLSYAEAFTQPAQRDRYGENGIDELKTAFKELMSACAAALRVNELSVGPDQATYHEVLKTSFQAMHERLETFFGFSLVEPDAEARGSSVADYLRSPIHILDSISGVERK